MQVLDHFEDIVHYLIAAVLLVVAGYVPYRTTSDLLSADVSFATCVTSAINDVLFVITLLELLRTVLAHFESTELQLEPFLIIGILSSVRLILTVGARLTLAGEGIVGTFNRSQLGLALASRPALSLRSLSRCCSCAAAQPRPTEGPQGHRQAKAAGYRLLERHTTRR